MHNEPTPQGVTIHDGATERFLPADKIDRRFLVPNRIGGIATIREAVELRIWSWPREAPNAHNGAGLARDSNLSAMQTIDRAARGDDACSIFARNG